MSTFTYKCPNCNGPLNFDPQKQKFACEYCLSEFTLEELQARVDDDTVQQETKAEDEVRAEKKAKVTPDAQGDELDDSVIYSCPNCGAEVVTDETTAASFCYYCHNPVVVVGRLKGKYKPDDVIPFKIEREEAVRRFLEWTSKKKLVPRGFFSKENIEKLTGVYFPFFTVSKDVSARLNATASNVRTWRTGDIMHTETSIYNVKRDGMMKFFNITKNALKGENRMLVESVLPFNIEDRKEFSMAYLSGFMAQRRDMEQDAFKGEIDHDVKGYTEALLRETLQYDEINHCDVWGETVNEEWRYLLMPVWVLTYRQDGKTYYYAMNGQTGKVAGDLPLSMKRLFMRFLIVTLPIFVILSLLGGFML